MLVTGDPISDEMIKVILARAALENPFYGYKKLTFFLKGECGIVINHKKIYRLCKEMELLLPLKKKRPASSSPIAFAKVPVSAPDKHWQMDITYITVFPRVTFLLDIIDSYTLEIVNYHYGFTVQSHEVVRTLKEALIRRKITGELAVRTDNGPQFLSKELAEFCKESNIRHERIPVCSPERNPNIERFHGTLKREFVYINEFDGYQDFSIRLYDYMEYYCNTRYHQSLNYMAPAKFKEAFLRNNATRGVLNL